MCGHPVEQLDQILFREIRLEAFEHDVRHVALDRHLEHVGDRRNIEDVPHALHRVVHERRSPGRQPCAHTLELRFDVGVERFVGGADG